MNKKELQGISGVTFSFSILIFFALGIIVGMEIVKDFIPETVNIPNSEMINNFCEASGYDMGWLSSSSCKKDEVTCMKEHGEGVIYNCLYWGVEQ